MSTHTPGPWENTPGQATIWANDGDLKVATVDDLPWIENSSGRRSSDWVTEAANARLIAAAPTLLAALEALYQIINTMPDLSASEKQMALQASEAISKATK